MSWPHNRWERPQKQGLWWFHRLCPPQSPRASFSDYYMTYRSYVQCTTCQMAPRRRAKDNWGIFLSSVSVADCGAPAELEHGLVTFSTRNNLTTYKSEIRYSCQQPYYKMYNNITGEPCILNQPPPTSHPLGFRVRLGAETANQLATVWQDWERKYLETCLASPWLKACTHPHSPPPTEKEPSGTWGWSVLTLPNLELWLGLALRKFS